MPAFCLSIHAEYRCGRSGACCTAGWRIPVNSGVLPVRDDGACVFYDTTGDGLCAIHRDTGAGALPVSCRNYPRVALHDARGTFVTLSAFCPTAARLLLGAGDIRIVDAPPSLTLNGTVEGLDATGVLPPLLRTGMLMDFEGYSAWEEEAIGVMNERRYSARAALAIVSESTQDVLAWRPGGESLAAAVKRAFARAATNSQRGEGSGPPVLEHAIKAFFASHLFGSWAAYQRGGLAAVVEELETAASLVEGARNPESFVEAVRAADLRLRHRSS